MASLINRNGNYYAQFSDAGRRPKRRRLSLKTSAKRTAERLLGKLEEAYRLGRWDPWLHDLSDYYHRPTEYHRIGELVRQFLEAKADQGRSQQTLSTYRSILKRFAEHNDAQTLLERIEPRDLRAFVRHGDVAKSTRGIRHCVVRAFLNWCEFEGYLSANPVSGVATPEQPGHLPRVIRPDVLDAICGAVRRDYERKLWERHVNVRGKCLEGELVWIVPLFWFALYTGMRISEVARLKWKHLDFRKGLIRIEEQKNGKAQTIPLTTRVRAILHDVERGEPDEFVFHAPRCHSTTDRSTKAFSSRVQVLFKRYRQAADVDDSLTFHGLRHGFCTMLAEAGKSAVVIKEAARHADISTSMRYVHMANEHLKAELEDVFGND